MRAMDESVDTKQHVVPAHAFRFDNPTHGGCKHSSRPTYPSNSSETVLGLWFHCASLTRDTSPVGELLFARRWAGAEAFLLSM